MKWMGESIDCRMFVVIIPEVRDQSITQISTLSVLILNQIINGAEFPRTS